MSEEAKHTPTNMREAVEDRYRAVHGDDMSAEDWYIFEDLYEVAGSTLRTELERAEKALAGVIAEADRETNAFIFARTALSSIRGEDQ